jgi:hypothetical protein
MTDIRRLARRSGVLSAAASALILAACASTSPDPPKASTAPEPPAAAQSAPRTAEATPEPEGDLVTREDFLTLVDGEVPEELKNALEIRNYSFDRTRIEERPEVRLDVFNLSNDTLLEFEIRTLFFREDGTIIDATEWARATARPRRSWRYQAISFTPWAVSEQVQLRLIQEDDAS